MTAARLGVDALFVSSEPLAHGASVPSIGRVFERLSAEGMAPALDVSRIRDEEDYFFDLAARTGRPTGDPVNAADQAQYAHQIPGNMVAFTQGQLAELKMEHLLPQVLEEFTQVRADMGYPVMVTPVSQLVCVQAVLNVVQGERYKSIPTEVRKYVQGDYGKPDAPIAGALLDRVGPPRPGAGQEDPVATLRRRLGPDVSDDDLLLRILFRPEQLQGIAMDSPLPPSGEGGAGPDATRLVELIRGLGGSRSTHLEIRQGRFSFTGRRRALPQRPDPAP